MDLIRHLRFFIAVAEERHFGQAAVNLGMTQPPLSQGVQRLERRLGVRLFDRDARGVRITLAGKSLLPLAEELVRSADAFVDGAQAWSAEPVMRIGVAGDLEDAIPRLVSAMSGFAADTQPHVAGSVELVDRLKDGDLDVVVVRHPGVLDGVVAGEVHTLPTRLMAPSDTDLRSTTLPVAVPMRRWQPAAHDQLVDSLRRLGHSGRVVEEADVVARRALVAAGVAVTFGVGHDEHAPLGLPLRVRAVRPVPAERQPGLDHDAVAMAVDRTLASLGATR